MRSDEREAGRLRSDDHEGEGAEMAGEGHGALAHDELVALGEALDRRVRSGTATLEDFGALARTRRELERRTEAGRRARFRGPLEPP